MLEQPAGDFPEQCVLGRDARFREQENGVKRGEHRLAGLLKPGPQRSILLQLCHPVNETVVKVPLGTRLPDAAKEID